MKDIYVKFGNPAIKGESQDKDHKDWIEVLSWEHNIKQPRSATASTAGGHTAERCEHGEMIFTKDMDVVSPLLYQHASGGTTFDEVTIDFMRADGEGKRVKYLEIKLKNAILGAVDAKVAAEGLPTDKFSLKYAAVQWKYTQQKIGGNQGGNSQGAWSLTKNDKTYSV
ncbi:type VI secretion system tube protein Hcp [Cupriavidus gilardii]|jgi:type VI secretion system secreted protein Hcp|uniref:Hcp family type VI secretion system effector n=2 Tax=Cupriavidus TaxID=106589 RepID=A0A5A8EQN4_9BURK|nr:MULTISPECIES: Hcp family type VI secretion system effector [Cupriavidus]ESJ24199.1 Hcp1 family type VI secretion system effector [Cupriavidus sp. HPC(L)]KAA0180126.1 type VI secretion system tube protein Hcp [Cupriavidus gilardii]KAA6125200.1 type VI secretion system tube protein Hcp [Cupriavidus cauae]KAB0597852.1 type VI secretion system tube protein Hcp [Cupriavidus gilardii]MBO4120760.1 type VI secretion system tube protein Hcp [Cupriavidus gilardii]